MEHGGDGPLTLLSAYFGMIVSHRYRLIFLKTRKTAGTSLELALSRFCEPGDLVTPLDEALAGEESTRKRIGGYGPDVPNKRLIDHRSVRDLRRLFRRRRKTPVIHPHSTAEDVRGYLGPHIWNNYFKVAVERNPWDRFISYYWWRRHRRSRHGAKEASDIHTTLQYLAARKPHLLSNWPIYTIDDEIVVDRVIHFETLSADVGKLVHDRKFPPSFDLDMPRAKASHRPPLQGGNSVLSQRDRAVVEEHCGREIETFGYCLDQNLPKRPHGL